MRLMLLFYQNAAVDIFHLHYIVCAATGLLLKPEACGIWFVLQPVSSPATHFVDSVSNISMCKHESSDEQ